MKRMSKYVALALTGIVAMGCNSGGGSGESQADVSGDKANSVYMGRVVEGKVEAFRLNDLTTPFEVTQTTSAASGIADSGKFDLALESVPDDEWMLISVSGGAAVDLNDDGALDDVATENRGTTYLLAKRQDLVSGVNVSVISDLIVRDLMHAGSLTSLTGMQIHEHLSSHAARWLRDINGDGAVNYEDVIAFSPLENRESVTVDWSAIREHYIKAVLSNHPRLVEKARLLSGSLETGYAGSERAATLVTEADDELMRVNAFSVEADGSADAVVVEGTKGDVYEKMRITRSSLGSNAAQYSISNASGNELSIRFMTDGNVLSTMDEYALDRFLVDAKIAFSEALLDENQALVLTIPKAIMASWAASEIEITINGKLVDKESLYVIEDDPVVGWYFPDDEKTYPDYGGEPIVISQESIVRNDGGLKISWREGDCQAGEEKLFESPYLIESTVVSDGLFNVCVRHDQFELTTASGTTLLKYHRETGQVFAGQADAKVKLGIQGRDADHYRVSAVISQHKPQQPSYDGWSSGISFGYGYLGDFASAKNKIWIAITPLDQHIIHNGKAYKPVTSPETGRIWLDRNLGASRVCESAVDEQCFGDYYQWGRRTDGHQDKGSRVTSLKYASPTSTGSRFAVTPPEDGGHDWVSSDADGDRRVEQWMDASGASVCPAGFRVPTLDEVRLEMNGVPRSNPDDATFQSFLKLPYAGWRRPDYGYAGAGAIAGDGGFGELWTVSRENNGNVGISRYERGLISETSTSSKTFGLSVRCINDG